MNHSKKQIKNKRSPQNQPTSKPQSSEEDLTESGIQTREDDENNKANRDI